MDDPSNLLRARLVELEAQEQTLSRARRQLHRRIEFLRGTGLFEPGSVELLAELDDQERSLSVQRGALHREIDRIRAQLADAAD